MCLFKISNESNLRLHKRQASLLISTRDDSLNGKLVATASDTVEDPTSLLNLFFCAKLS